MDKNKIIDGSIMYKWAAELFPINRSITGEGVRKTLRYIQKEILNLKIKEIPSGKKVFDWIVPNEWYIKDAYILNEDGSKVVDIKENNLHIVGYSEPIKKSLSLDELDPHLYSLPDKPDAIPYVTSYYKRDWGFCLTHNQRKKLKPGFYNVVIESEIKKGVLNYGEVIIPGQEKKEIFLSTYICHPSIANNEISGPVVTMALIKWICSKPRRYTYRIIFIPETIGSISYLSINLEKMKSNVIAGYNITCIGDDRCYSYLPSRNGNTISDLAAKHVLKNIDPSFKKYTWLDRGSDERQYCSPGIDLPIATIMRSKYGEYPEYHTSLDNLNFISPTGLSGGFHAIMRSLQVIEENRFYKALVLGEPQLGRRNLYPNLGTKKNPSKKIEYILNFLSYADGTNSLLEIANKINVAFWDLSLIVQDLIKLNLVVSVENENT